MDRPDPTDQKYRIFFPEESSTKTETVTTDADMTTDLLVEKFGVDEDQLYGGYGE